MSILLCDEIKEERSSGKILIEPYNESYVGPNSYDVRLGSEISVYKNFPLDSRKENIITTSNIGPSGLIFTPNTLYLAHTIEKIGSDYYVPMYEGRSSMARLGVQSHISAGFGDIGFKSQWTLEIIVTHPVILYAGDRIGQIHFHKVNEKYNNEANRYHGKYVDQSGPQSSKSFLDGDGGITPVNPLFVQSPITP
jgi:deoxycytidine triphosphate deaminase